MINNQLSGPIPTQLGQLRKLTNLSLSDNKLTGRNSVGTRQSRQTARVDLGTNLLTGVIPRELSGLTNLEWLDLENNDLKGEIPVEFGDLAKIKWMYFGGNRLAGRIPNELGRLSNLHELFLVADRQSGQLLTEGSNSLFGCIPSSFQEIEKNDFEQLGLPFCGDESVLSPETCNDGVAVPRPESDPGLVSDCEILLSIRKILAGTADLNWSGVIPITDWDGVTLDELSGRVFALDLSGRGLNGSIPRDIGDLHSLQHVNLRDNRLIGTIPANFPSMYNLKTLDLSLNRLSGEIPSVFGDLAE